MSAKERTTGATGGPGPEHTWAERFPELRAFLGAYFHQDWTLKHQTPDEVIHEYIADAPREDLSRALGELQRLLGLGLSEGQLELVLSSGLRSDCVPSFAGGSNTLWLQEIERHLKEALASEQ
jgi:CdiI immunity protein